MHDYFGEPLTVFQNDLRGITSYGQMPSYCPTCNVKLPVLKSQRLRLSNTYSPSESPEAAPVGVSSKLRT